MDSETLDTMYPTTDEIADMSPIPDEVEQPEPPMTSDEALADMAEPAQEPQPVELTATQAFNILLQRQMQVVIAVAQLHEQVTTALDVMLATANRARRAATKKRAVRKTAKKGRGGKRR